MSDYRFSAEAQQVDVFLYLDQISVFGWEGGQKSSSKRVSTAFLKIPSLDLNEI